MFRSAYFSTAIVTLCMILYQVFSYLGMFSGITILIFLISPLLMLWMVLTILKDKKGNVKELKEGEEWGYGDIDKDTLGIF